MRDVTRRLPAYTCTDGYRSDGAVLRAYVAARCSWSGAVYLDDGVPLPILRALIRRHGAAPVWRGVGRRKRLVGAWTGRETDR